MAFRFGLVILATIAAASALPAGLDPVIAKLDPEGLRYGYIRDDDGVPHLVDSWIKASDLARNARYNPDTDNEYHLYTRSNPLISQPIVEGNAQSLASSNFSPNKRTIILIHGFLGDILSGFNSVLVPAFLLAGDVNVIVVDWGAGAHWGLNGISSGRTVGRFIQWINTQTGASLNNYHVLGYSVGAHQAGIVGRTLLGQVGYITAMDPAARWLNSQAIQASDAVYTEVIHTNIGNIGMEQPRGDVDIYPNGGVNMPGCATALCDHYRSYFYVGESVATGGFTATQCNNLDEAKAQTCSGPDTIRMGGLLPKTGTKGIYSLSTNASPPFSQG
ncbi:pancreatic lipase-related protein 2-like [Trichoplusia ni]|uniref:Pancreatic lipase-related protein 2-like n=1 Tax=Trichoplusia ni TaxID=7111 RepID=A0A7E5X5S3_TRINI|nr:pancreatic lipase-related protein 2-like [Trichoplusia ni]